MPLFDLLHPDHLVRDLRQVLQERPAETVVAMLDRFHTAFSPDRLRHTHGVELLELVRAQGRTSMTWWLEHRNEPEFVTRWFGSIRGGSALKFVVYQDAEGRWMGGAGKPHEVSQSEAVAVVEAQRDELLAALAVVDQLPDDPAHPAWGRLQSDISTVAPRFSHLAFFHKNLALWRPERIDDYHSLPHQAPALIWMGAPVDPAGLWANARCFRDARLQLAEPMGQVVPMCLLGHALNRQRGPIRQVWRVGGTTDSHDAVANMLDTGEAAVGWTQLGHLGELVGDHTGRSAQKVLRDAILDEWPQTHPTAAGRGGAQLQRFLHKVSDHDLIVLAKGMQVQAIGRVSGDYQFKPDQHFGHRRRVEWLDRGTWKTHSKAGLRTTLHEITRAWDFHGEVVRRLRTRGQPSKTSSSTPSPESTPPSPVVVSILEQAARKGQVLLYGPPGTGKTFHAMRAAEELAAHGRHGRSWRALKGAERQALKGPGDGQRIWTCTFHPAYGYEDFVEGLRPVATEAGLTFHPRPGLFRRICAVAAAHPREQVVVVIDEFNRGDVARIFGELLTLLELDKREQVHVVLPYSGEAFTVPENVRLIATMNTSDRSIALLDAALQRRLGKVELLPDPTILEGAVVSGISLAGLLTAVNRRLLEVLGDRARDLQVGHAYLMRNRHPLSTLTGLRDVVQYDLLPLLQDYCADDPHALARLVGDALYDTDRRRFATEPFAPGEDDRLVGALLDWGTEVGADDPVEEDDQADPDDSADPDATDPEAHDGIRTDPDA